jgi:hypothetical protein
MKSEIHLSILLRNMMQKLKHEDYGICYEKNFRNIKSGAYPSTAYENVNEK